MKNNSGFSLIELMAVTVIMGLLATLSVPLGEMIYMKNKEEEVVETVTDFRRALDLYYEDHGYFPPVTSGETARDAIAKLVEEGYLRGLPKNPYTNSYTDWEIRDSTGSEWVIVSNYGDTNPPDQNLTGILATVSGSVRINRITDIMDIRFPSQYDVKLPSGRPMSTL